MGTSYAGDADFSASAGTLTTPARAARPAADLGVTFTSKTPDWAPPGSIIKVSLRTTNDGPSSTTDANTTLPLPRGWRVRRTSHGAVVRHRELTVNGDLAAGEACSAFVVLRVGAKLKASVTSNVPDPTPADNRDRMRIRGRRL